MQPGLLLCRQVGHFGVVRHGDLQAGGVLVELTAKQADILFRAVALLAAVNDPLDVIGPKVDEDTAMEPLTVFVGGPVAIRDGFMDPGILPFAPFPIEVGKGDLPGIDVVGPLIVVVQAGQGFFPGREIA